MPYPRHHFFKITGEELTEWEEGLGSCDEDEDIKSENSDRISGPFIVNCKGRTTLMRPSLERAKKALIDRLLREF